MVKRLQCNRSLFYAFQDSGGPCQASSCNGEQCLAQNGAHWPSTNLIGGSKDGDDEGKQEPATYDANARWVAREQTKHHAVNLVPA